MLVLWRRKISGGEFPGRAEEGPRLLHFLRGSGDGPTCGGHFGSGGWGFDSSGVYSCQPCTYRCASRLRPSSARLLPGFGAPAGCGAAVRASSSAGPVSVDERPQARVPDLHARLLAHVRPPPFFPCPGSRTDVAGPARTTRPVDSAAEEPGAEVGRAHDASAARLAPALGSSYYPGRSRRRRANWSLGSRAWPSSEGGPGSRSSRHPLRPVPGSPYVCFRPEACYRLPASRYPIADVRPRGSPRRRECFSPP